MTAPRPYQTMEDLIASGHTLQGDSRRVSIQGDLTPHMPSIRASMANLLTPTGKEPASGHKFDHESDLSKASVSFFRSIGLRDRTDYDISRGGELAGWYFHIRESKGNPYTLDYVVLFLTGEWCEIELKSATGKLTDIQSAILNYGGPVFRCDTIEQVQSAVFAVKGEK